MKNAAPAPEHGKYFLRSLHQEIDLYDRKLAYMAKYEVFATTADRELAEKKMLAKRATLEKRQESWQPPVSNSVPPTCRAPSAPRTKRSDIVSSAPR